MALQWVKIGNLKGPMGPAGDAASLGRFQDIEARLAKALVREIDLALEDLDDLRTQGIYPQRLSGNATAQRHYPEAARGVLIVHRLNDTLRLQTYVSALSGKSYVRQWDGGAWGAWHDSEATAEEALRRLPAIEEVQGRALVRQPDLGGTDLDTVRVQGIYPQGDSAQTSRELHYPEFSRGTLLVHRINEFARAQTYLSAVSGKSYSRQWDGSTWGAWYDPEGAAAETLTSTAAAIRNEATTAMHKVIANKAHTGTVVRGAPVFGPAKFGNGMSGAVISVNKECIAPKGTVECWVTAPAGQTGGVKVAVGGADTSYWLGMSATGTAAFGRPGTGIISTTQINDGQWHHLALVATGTEYILYVDGVQAAVSNSAHILSLPVVYIGGNATGFDWPGMIDNVRISSRPRYTANFTPPSASFTYDSATLLIANLASLDMTTASGAYPERPKFRVSGKQTMTAALVGTPAFPGGKFSGAITGGAMTVDPGTLNTPVGTLECWVRNTVAPTGVSVAVGGMEASTSPWIGLNAEGFVTMGLLVVAPTTVQLGTGWHHLALVFSDGRARLWIDGQLAGDRAYAAGMALGGLSIGGRGAAFTWPGSVSEVRASNVARYTAPFTPPTQQFVWDGGTLMLARCEGPQVEVMAGYMAGPAPGYVTYFGPTQPTDALPNDEWIKGPVA